MFHRSLPTFLVGLLVLGAAGCATSAVAEPSPTTNPGSDAACLAGDLDCYETGAEHPDVEDPGAEHPDIDSEQASERAVDLLGLAESNVPTDVRVARRGSDTFALTEDYVIGRVTVELDDTDGSGFRVVTATVELPEGVATFELTPG